jgi:hypothetical protein
MGSSAVAAVVAGIGLLLGVAAAAVSLLSGSETEETNRKKMKAPGRINEVIYRDEFARDPKGYFRDLHKK